MLWLPAGADRTPRNAPLVRPPPAAGVTSTSATSTQSSSGGPLRCSRWSFGGLAPDRAAVRHPRAHVGVAPTAGCRCRPKLAALSWAPTRCSGAVVLRERRRERRGWAATGGGAKERRRGWGLEKNRLKRYFLCSQWYWWVINHQLHEEVQKRLFWSS